jgi:hypothetical protein
MRRGRIGDGGPSDSATAVMTQSAQLSREPVTISTARAITANSSMVRRMLAIPRDDVISR